MVTLSSWSPYHHAHYIYVAHSYTMFTLWPGLKNQGCACYMNSVLQQLFAIPDFRSAILRCNVPQGKSFMDDGNTEDNGQGANTIVKRNNNRDVFFQTQRTFQHLNDGTRRAFVDPVGLVRAFTDRNPTFKRNSHECAHEFLLLILDQLEKHFEAAPAESFANQLANCIGGAIETIKKCTVCQLHTTIDNKPFKNLQVNVRSTESEEPCNTIERCIHEFTKPETLQLECSNCQRHTETTLTRSVSTLEQVAFYSQTHSQFDLCFIPLFEIRIMLYIIPCSLFDHAHFYNMFM